MAPSVIITLQRTNDAREFVNALKTLAAMRGDLESKKNKFKSNDTFKEFKNTLKPENIKRLNAALRASSNTSDVDKANQQVAEYRTSILEALNDIERVFTSDIFSNDDDVQIRKYREAYDTAGQHQEKLSNDASWLYDIDAPDPRLTSEGLDNTIKDSLTLYYTKSTTYIEDRSLVESFYEFLAGVNDAVANDVDTQLESPAMVDLARSQLSALVPNDARKWNEVLPSVVRRFRAYTVGRAMDYVLTDLESLRDQLLATDAVLVRQYLSSDRLTKGIATFDKYANNPVLLQLTRLIQDLRNESSSRGFNGTRIQTALLARVSPEDDIKTWLNGGADVYNGLRAALADKTMLINKALVLGFQQPASISSYKDIKGLPQELYPIVGNLCQAVDAKDLQMLRTFDQLVKSLLDKQEDAIKKNQRRGMTDTAYRLPLKEMLVLSRTVGGARPEDSSKGEEAFYKEHKDEIDELTKHLLRNDKVKVEETFKKLLRESSSSPVDVIELIESSVRRMIQGLLDEIQGIDTHLNTDNDNTASSPVHANATSTAVLSSNGNGNAVSTIVLPSNSTAVLSSNGNGNAVSTIVLPSNSTAGLSSNGNAVSTIVLPSNSTADGNGNGNAVSTIVLPSDGGTMTGSGHHYTRGSACALRHGYQMPPVHWSAGKDNMMKYFVHRVGPSAFQHGGRMSQDTWNKLKPILQKYFGIVASNANGAKNELSGLGETPITKYVIQVINWLDANPHPHNVPKFTEEDKETSVQLLESLIEVKRPSSYSDVSEAPVFTGYGYAHIGNEPLPQTMTGVDLVNAWTRSSSDHPKSIFMFHIRLPSGAYVAFDGRSSLVAAPWIHGDDVTPYTFYFTDAAGLEYAPVSLATACGDRTKYYLRCLDTAFGSRHVAYGKDGLSLSVAPDTVQDGCAFVPANQTWIPQPTSITASMKNDGEFLIRRSIEQSNCLMSSKESSTLSLQCLWLSEPSVRAPASFSADRMCLHVSSSENGDVVELKDRAYLLHAGKHVVWWQGFLIRAETHDNLFAFRTPDSSRDPVPIVHSSAAWSAPDTYGLIDKSDDGHEIGVDASGRFVAAHAYCLVRRDKLQYLAFDMATKASFWTPFRNHAADVYIVDTTNGQPSPLSTRSYGQTFVFKVALKDGSMHYVRRHDPSKSLYLTDLAGGHSVASVFKPERVSNYSGGASPTKVEWSKAFQLVHVKTPDSNATLPFEAPRPIAVGQGLTPLPVFPNGEKVFAAHDHIVDILTYYNMLPDAGGKRAGDIRAQSKSSAKAVGSVASLESITPKNIAMSIAPGNTDSLVNVPVVPDIPAAIPLPSPSHRTSGTAVGRKASAWLTSNLVKGPLKVVSAGSAKAERFADSMSIIEKDDINFLDDAISYTVRSLREMQGSAAGITASEKARAYVFALFDTVLDTAKRYFRRHLRFATQELRQYLRYRSRFPGAKDADSNAGQQGGAMWGLDPSSFATFDSMVEALSRRANEHLTTIKETVEQRFPPNQYVAYFTFPPDAEDIGERRAEVFDRIDGMADKIYKMYSNSLGFMDVVLDDQFIAMYVVKGLRIAFAFGALAIVQRIFEQMYIKEVYTENSTPPSLYNMILMFIGVELMFNVMLSILLGFVYLLSIKVPGFVVDAQLIQKYAVDYACTTLLVALVGAVIARVVTRKKYFKYKVEGLRAIRAFRDILFYVAIVVILVPFFMLF